MLSEQLGDLSFEDVARLEKLLARANLPTVSPDTMQPDDYLPHMMRDKKSAGRQVTSCVAKSPWSSLRGD